MPTTGMRTWTPTHVRTTGERITNHKENKGEERGTRNQSSTDCPEKAHSTTPKTGSIPSTSTTAVHPWTRPVWPHKQKKTHTKQTQQRACGKQCTAKSTGTWCHTPLERHDETSARSHPERGEARTRRKSIPRGASQLVRRSFVSPTLSRRLADETTSRYKRQALLCEASPGESLRSKQTSKERQGVRANGQTEQKISPTSGKSSRQVAIMAPPKTSGDNHEYVTKRAAAQNRRQEQTQAHTLRRARRGSARGPMVAR